MHSALQWRRRREVNKRWIELGRCGTHTVGEWTIVKLEELRRGREERRGEDSLGSGDEGRIVEVEEQRGGVEGVRGSWRN